MKDVVQVKTEIIEHQHDALIEFYEVYPRLFANKVLLKLGESFLDMHPPTLADFETLRPAPQSTRRNIVIRIDKMEFPKLWDFYRKLPYGSRKTVIVNVLNTYAQIAEADKAVMEKAYWGTPIATVNEDRSDVASQPLQAKPLQNNEVEIEEIVLEPAEGKENSEEEPDPLFNLETGLL